MCGIAGGIYYKSAPDELALRASAAQLAHRGPDEQDVFISRNVGLVHTRLSIIDLAGGHQPLHNFDGSMHLVANGEIYNYIELQAEYQNTPYKPKTGSDSECLLSVYQQKGKAGIKDLNGMFAFALHDEKNQSVLLGRDRLGIKPLFYADTPEGVFFASELKALLPSLPFSPEINPGAFREFLDHQFCAGRETIFKGIQRVLPGECLEIKNGNIEHYQYWRATNIEPQNLNIDQALEAFQPIFSQVMKEHMRADVPYGLFLSGGIDSSILLAELYDQQGSGLKTFSVGYEGVDMEDELGAAEHLSKQFSTDHHSFRVTREQLFGRIVHSIWACDDLMRDYACLPTSLISEMAASELKVVFSGEGGDESFAGYRRYAPSMENKLKALLLGVGGVRHKSQWSSEGQKLLLGTLLKNQSPRNSIKHYWNSAPQHWSLMQKKQYLDLSTALPDNLFVKADRIMMAFGLEGRVPLADHRLVEFGLSLPDNVKYQNGRGKHLLRTWAENKFSNEHLKRPKSGFYVPVKEWMKGKFLRDLGEKLLVNPAVKQWFNVEGLKQVLTAQQNGKNYSRELWCVMQFAIWHKLFIENPGVKPSVQENPIDWL